MNSVFRFASPRRDDTVRVVEGLLLLGLCLPAGCNGGGSKDETDGTSAAATAGAGTEGSMGTAASGGSAGSESSGTTGGSGVVGGLLTFTYYPADAMSPEPILGLAGGLRQGGIDGIRDFFAVYAWQMTFPAAPTDADTIVEEEIPVPFDWGQPEDWVGLGGGIKLMSGDRSALACLLYVDEEYPVYAAEDSSLLDPACAPDPESFVPEGTYDVLVYGGDAFADVRIDGLVATPPALSVASPDLSVVDLPVPQDAPLDLAWEPGAEGDTVVIRLWDQYGRMLTATAADDGAFTIPAELLATLSAGQAHLTLARERVADLPLPDGTLTVAARYEVWGYIDLVAGG